MTGPVCQGHESALHDVLFGAFDRHNLGDLLFAHLALGEIRDPRRASLAGLVAADLRAFGGHRVESLAEVLARHARSPLRLTHVGGETLACERWVARITTLADGEAAAAVARYQRDPVAREAWLTTQPAFSSPVPYVVRRSDLPPGSQTVFRAVGGVGVAALDEAARNHVLAALREAEQVSVRDSNTRRALAEAGIDAALEPDPVAGIRARFGRQIFDRLPRIGRGHLAVQFSAEFGDDATLDRLAAQIRSIVHRFRLPVVLFRAGAAPWHDDSAVLDRLRSRLADVPLSMFFSLDIWDICGLIAGAAGAIGSSLHVRIIAEAFGRPVVSLLGDDMSPTGQAAKLRAYVETWFADAPRLATIDGLASTFSAAMAD